MGFQLPTAAPTQAGPAGLVYADVPNRVIAYIIDVIILAVINFIIGAILVGLTLGTGSLGIGWLIWLIVALAINLGYFVYMWTAMRGTIGMKALGMQIGNAADGKTMTMDQAIRRWIFVGGWIAVANLFTSVFGFLGILVSLVALAYVIYLLYTTAQSPTKQGFHDIQAHTMVVKASRSVAV